MYLFLLLGEWYGVEWDEHSRGKHNGTREGMKYFESRYECHIVVKHWNIFISSTLLKDYYVNFAVKMIFDVCDHASKIIFINQFA